MRRAAACDLPSLLRSFGGTVVMMVMATAQAAAQTTTPPGPWVLDVRGVTSPVPTDAGFYPPLAATSVPSRGFGADFGAHVYLGSLKLARIGFGANFVIVRSAVDAPVAATEDEATESAATQRVTLNMRMLAPQVSANFGTRDGWSYLSAGVGIATVATEAADEMPGRQESGRLRSVNFGGGARWFITPRLAFGFDLRAHRIAAGSGTPKTSVFAVGAGLSIR
ncbi:MAG: outer membrane beta-barrel protein [Vicinamibacterales bacterium]